MKPIVKVILYAPLNAISLVNLWNRARIHRKRIDTAPRQRHNDLVLNYSSRLLKIFNIKVNVINRQNLIKAPALLVPNHVNNLDVFVLMQAVRKNTDDRAIDHNMISFVAKNELYSKRTVRYGVQLLDGVFIKRDKPLEAWRGMKNFIAMLKDEKKIGVVFPEGTRGDGKQVAEFKKAIFKLAKMHLMPIIPVTINNSNVGISLKTAKPTTVDVIFHKPIKLQQIAAMSEDVLAKNTQSIVAAAYKGIDNE